MEKLQRIQLAGFRSIRSLDLELGDITVLIGANGSGKSNFIGFFHMLNFMLTESLQVYVGRKGGGSSVLHYGPKTTPAMHAELHFVGNDATTSKYGFTLAFAAPDAVLFTDEHLAFQKHDAATPFTKQLGAGHLETKLLAISKAQGESVERTVARVFAKRLKAIQVYHFHDTSDSAYIRASQDIRRNHELLSHGGNLAAFLYMLKETKPHVFERIISIVRLAVPYIKELILEPDQLNPEKIQLRWRDHNPDYEFGPHQLSDGSLRAIAMITALAQPEEMLPSIIFMDEPELGLHPSAIGIVADLVHEVCSKRQVIIATQSPRFLAHFSPDRVVVAERKDNSQGRGKSTYRRLSAEDLSVWLEDYDLGELFEKNVTGGWPQ